MIARARRHRFSIGLIAAYALLLSALLPAFASADPLQAYLGAHLCGPSGSQGDNAPTTPAEHQQKCQLCGPSCSMGGHATVATLADGVISIARFDAPAGAPHRIQSETRSPLSRYPSDGFSQGPPQAA